MNDHICLKERMQEMMFRAGRRYVSLSMALMSFMAMAMFVAGCGEKVSPGTAAVERIPVSGVTIADIKPSQVDDYYETPGTVKARNIGVISSKIMGSITFIAVKEGEQVKKGQVLLTIDDRDVAEKVRAAQNAVASAQEQKKLADVTLGRYKKLYDEKALSRQEFDQVETQKNVAESEYERAKAILREAEAIQGYARVRAPFAGVVTGKKIDTGSMAVPGMHLLTVEDTSAFLVEAAMDERLAAHIKPGIPVNVAIDSINRNMNGRISEVVPSIDPSTRTFVVKITVSGAGLKTGLYARVRIPNGRREALTVPASSIVEKGQLTGVYAVDAKGIVAYRLVRIGNNFGNSVEVLSGLVPGDRIIVAGLEKAVDGGIMIEAQGK
jgi:RND family efflux transporter MFP subunit